MADEKPFVVFQMRINITEEMMAFANFQAARLRYADAEDYLGAILAGALHEDWETFETGLEENDPDARVEDFLISHGYLAKDFWQRQPPEPPLVTCMRPKCNPLLSSFIVSSLARAQHAQQCPIRQACRHIGQGTFERSHPRVADDGDQEPREDHEVASLGTPKKGLEGIEKVVYVAGYACASPHGLAPVSIGVWQPSNIHRSPCFSSIFLSYHHSGDPAPATFEFKTPSVRRAAFWLLKPPQKLKSDQEAFITQLCTLSTEIKEVYEVAHAFEQLLRERQAEGLATWLAHAEQSAVSELRSFATGIRQDEAAVTAALVYDWSNGQVEGQINKLKLLKRQMYGRAKLDLLKARFLEVA
jgi:hypothetical protein